MTKRPQRPTNVPPPGPPAYLYGPQTKLERVADFVVFGALGAFAVMLLVTLVGRLQ